MDRQRAAGDQAGRADAEPRVSEQEIRYIVAYLQTLY
jgi:hypothetical protein